MTVSKGEVMLASYSYNAASKVVGVTRAKGVYSLYDYNAAGRLHSLEHYTTSKTLASDEYTYDEVSNRVLAVECMAEIELSLPTSVPCQNI